MAYSLYFALPNKLLQLVTPAYLTCLANPCHKNNYFLHFLFSDAAKNPIAFLPCILLAITISLTHSAAAVAIPELSLPTKTINEIINETIDENDQKIDLLNVKTNNSAELDKKQKEETSLLRLLSRSENSFKINSFALQKNAFEYISPFASGLDKIHHPSSLENNNNDALLAPNSETTLIYEPKAYINQTFDFRSKPLSFGSFDSIKLDKHFAAPVKQHRGNDILQQVFDLSQSNTTGKSEIKVIKSPAKQILNAAIYLFTHWIFWLTLFSYLIIHRLFTLRVRPKDRTVKITANYAAEHQTNKATGLKHGYQNPYLQKESEPKENKSGESEIEPHNTIRYTHIKTGQDTKLNTAIIMAEKSIIQPPNMPKKVNPTNRKQ